MWSAAPSSALWAPGTPMPSLHPPLLTDGPSLQATAPFRWDQVQEAPRMAPARMNTPGHRPHTRPSPSAACRRGGLRVCYLFTDVISHKCFTCMETFKLHIIFP